MELEPELNHLSLSWATDLFIIHSNGLPNKIRYAALISHMFRHFIFM